MRARMLSGLAIMLALGCSSYKIASVSGKVTLNGEPLAKATVGFQPITDRPTKDAGPSSIARTNEKGEYTLKTITGQKGALVGKHQVTISLLDPQVGNSDERAPRGGWPLKDRVPNKYNEKTELTFDVPRGGTSKADFVLTSP